MPKLRVRAVGIENLMEKLNVEQLSGPARRRFVREAGEIGADHLRPLIPRDTGALASTMQLSIRDEGVAIEDVGARLSVGGSSLGYIARFLEWGTKAGAAKRHVYVGSGARRRRTTRRSGGTQRIKARKFMAKTIGRVRREMRARLLSQAASDIEEAWGR